MAYINPYSLADSFTQLKESQIKTAQQRRESDIEVGTQKDKMEKQYIKDIEAAEKKAQDELNKKRSKKNKGFKLMTTLLSAFNPIAGAVIGGIDTATQSKKSAKHMLDRAIGAQKYAQDIDPRWGKTFLGKGEGGSRDYLSKAEGFYGDLVRQASEAQPSALDSFKTAAMSGIGSFATGKAMEGLGGLFKKMPTEGPLNLGQENLGETLSNLVEAPAKNTPFANLFDNLGPYLKGVGTKFGKDNPFGEGEGGQGLKGLLAILSQLGK